MSDAGSTEPTEPTEPCDDPAWGYVSPGETRWPAAASVAAVIAVQLLLPDRLAPGPTWLIPAIEAGVLLTLLIVGPSRLSAEAKDVREVALALIAIVVAANTVTLFFLLHILLGNGQMVEGRTLIYSAVAVWANGVIAFGLLYWETDRGGPIARCWKDHPAPDLLFPQMSSPTSTAHRWTPRYVDYLYVSLTNSVAFSPTDALPLTLRAKVVMAAQSLASLATIVVVGARAVNILN